MLASEKLKRKSLGFLFISNFELTKRLSCPKWFIVDERGLLLRILLEAISILDFMGVLHLVKFNTVSSHDDLLLSLNFDERVL